MQGTPVGEMLFKLLIQSILIDTRAETSHPKEILTHLESYTAIVNSNPYTFNKYVKVNMEGFKARGETKDDLMTNMFKAYHVTDETEFSRYIKTKKERYDEG